VLRPGPLDASVLPFIALWLAGFFSLQDRGRSRPVAVLVSFLLAIPVWVVVMLLYMFFGAFLFGTGAI
jgi:hypothetical protein